MKKLRLFFEEAGWWELHRIYLNLLMGGSGIILLIILQHIKPIFIHSHYASALIHGTLNYIVLVNAAYTIIYFVLITDYRKKLAPEKTQWLAARQWFSLRLKIAGIGCNLAAAVLECYYRGIC